MGFTIADSGGTLSGSVMPTMTLAYSATITLQGNVTPGGNGITPTVTIESGAFGGMVSGRVVQRQFTFTGEIREEGDELAGIYTEVVSGFTPQPLTMRGLFLVIRQPGSENGAVNCINLSGPTGVRVEDIQVVATRWGRTAAVPDPDENPATPNYEATFDLNGNGTIEITDITRIAALWGSCS